MSNRFVLFLLMASVLATATGCRQQAGGSAVQGSAAGSPASAESGASGTLQVGEISSVHQGEAVTDAEAVELAKALEQSIATGDADAFNGLFDWSAFEELILVGIPSNSSTARDIRTGVSRAMNGASAELASQIVMQSQQGGSYVFLRVRERPGGKCLLFRMQSAAGALNYHEIFVARRGSGARGVDINIYLTGERMSESVHRVVVLGVPPAARTAFGGRGKATISYRDMEKYSELARAVRSGQGRQALGIYAALPVELRKTKAAKLLHVKAANLVDDDTYIAAIDDFKAAFPKETALHLISIDGYFLRKDFDAVHESITALDEAIGGDPYLMVLHANAFVAEGKIKLARQIADTQLRLDPKNVDVHWLLITIALQEKDYAAVARLLTRIRDELGVPIVDLQTVPEYAEFVKSPEYTEWLKTPPK